MAVHHVKLVLLILLYCEYRAEDNLLRVLSSG